LMTIVQIARQNGGDWQWELLYDPADGDDRSIDDDVADDDDDDDDTVVDPIGSLAAVETSADDLRLVYWNVVTEHLDLLTPGAGGYDVETLTSFSGQPHKMQLLIDEADRNHLVLRRYNNVDYLTDQSGIWTEYSLFADPNYYTNPDNHFATLRDDDGDLHIAFYDVAAEKTAYLFGRPGAWDLSYPEGGEECYGPKIAFDGDGELHLLCQTRSFLLHLQGTPGDWTSEEIPLVSDDLLLFDFTVEDNGLLTLFFIDEDALTVISN
ncbi:MAG TPA: hypothetical protein PK961_15080, partial [bacterium]|nr:hypothetical protein [bacterium]